MMTCSKPAKDAIEQDLERLLAISRFTFDIHNRDFVAYFIGRTGQVITACECGWPRVIELATNPPNDSWRITRGKLQNCWEIFGLQNGLDEASAAFASPLPATIEIPAHDDFAPVSPAPVTPTSFGQLDLF